MDSLPFALPGSGGRPVRGEVNLPLGTGRHGAVVCVHGFKGFRRWGFWPYLADSLARAGLVVVRFDMSHNGVGAGGLEFDEEELFQANTWSREEEDLGTVLGALLDGRLPGAERTDPERLTLLGHSRGGGLAVARAADDPAVRTTVTLAPVASAPRFAPEAVREAEEQGWLPVVNTRTGQVLRMGVDAVRDCVSRTDLADLAASYASRLATPLLVCHGTEDASVPPSAGRRLAESAPRGRLVLFPGADHVLGCRHPFAGPTPDLERFLTLAADAAGNL